MEARLYPHQSVVAILLAAAVGLTSPAGATSSATFPVLSGASDFHVIVHISPQGKDYPPGIGGDTEIALAAILVEALRANGLRYDDQSALKLVITVGISYDREKSEWVAIAMRLDLHEPVTLKRPLSKRLQDHRTGVTWTTSSVDLVHVATSKETILSRARRAASFFVSSVNQVNRQAKPE